MSTASCYDDFHGTVAASARASLRHRVLSTLRTWASRSRSRAQLRDLDERLLQDIGVRHADALFEAGKPFWKP